MAHTKQQKKITPLPIISQSGKKNKAAEKELKKMKSAFITAASHEMRTPLAIIKWLTEVLLGGKAGKLSKEQKELIQNIQESNERMIRTINHLFDIF